MENQQQQPPQSQQTEKPKKPIWKRWWFWLIAIFVILIIASMGGEKEKTTPIVEEPAVEATWQEVATFSGKGNQDTSSFSVTGDRVKITATTCCGSPTSIGTYSGISLESDKGGYLGPGLSISTDGAEEGRGETTYRNLRTGDYYIRVISGVNWEVKVEEYR